MFSKACEYGIRAVIIIESYSKNNKKIGIKEICNGINAPEPFTAKILQNLRKLEIISSTKGPNGGFFIERDKDIKLLEIVLAIDGNKIITECGLGIKECSELKPCPIHADFKPIRESLKQVLEKTSVRQVTEDMDKGLSFLKK
jgi:Rrf2 family iron-sulfur cluster assembly transcriptional regulator